jgi:hypothetical protein
MSKQVVLLRVVVVQDGFRYIYGEKEDYHYARYAARVEVSGT